MKRQHRTSVRRDSERRAVGAAYAALILFAICIPVSYAETHDQGEVSLPDTIPAPQVMAASTGAGDLAIPEVPFKSPEAAAFMKYGETGVNGFTGQAEIQIPVYVATDRDISIPITLRYDTRGIKVAQEASWVGLGWDLNIGGCVNVVASGGLDYFLPEAPWGAYRNLLNSNPAPEFIKQTDTDTLLLKDLECGLGEPDFYSVNLPGCSFLFFRNPYDGKLTVIGAENEFYSINPTAQGWKIRDDRGYAYTFEQTEYSVNGSSVLYNSAYYLTLIESPQGATARFVYGETTILRPYPQCVQQYDTQRIGRVEQGYSLYTTPPAFSSHVSYSEAEVQKPWLTRIELDNQTVYLDLADRIDFRGAKRLDRVRVRNINDETVSVYHLNYGNFQHSNVGGSCLSTGSIQYNDPAHGQRLKLLSLSQVSTASPDSLTYRFEYDESVPLPLKTSYAVDLWGYYNGAENSSSGLADITDSHTLIPSVPDCIIGYNFSYTVNQTTYWKRGAPRFSDSSRMKSCILRKITYPTGGYTVLEYEPHRFVSSPVFPIDGEGLFRMTCNLLDNNHTGPVSRAQIDVPCTSTVNIDFSFTASGTTNLSNLRHTNATVSITPMHPPFTGGVTISLDSCTDVDYGQSSYTGWRQLELPPNSYMASVSLNDALTGEVRAEIRLDGAMDTITSGGAGLRVASLSNYDTDGSLAGMKTYGYVKTDGSTSGRALCNGRLIEWRELHSEGMQPGSSNGIFAHSTYDVIRIHSGFIGIPAITGSLLPGNVGYGRVVETEYGSDMSVIRSMVSVYDNTPAETPVPDLHVLKNFSLGSLLRSSVLSATADTLLTTAYAYQDSSPGHIKCCAFLDNNYYAYDHSVQIHVPPHYRVFVYSYPRYWHRLIREIRREHTSDGVVQTEVSYTYKQGNRHVYTETVSAAGQLMKTEYRYPSDLAGVSVFAAMCDTVNFMDGICVERREYINSSGNGPQAMKTRRTYTHNSTASMMFQPTGISQSIGGNTLRTRMSAKYDDEKGNLVERIADNTEKTVYLWSYGNTLPVARIEGASLTQVQGWMGADFIRGLKDATGQTEIREKLMSLRATLNSRVVLLTTYEYRPLVGATRETLPNGSYLSYEYDGFGRLVRVRDNEGRIIQEHEYNIGTNN